MKIITLYFFILIFILLRPYHLQQSGLLYGGDDYSYFAHASSLAFGQFPSYEKEHFISGDRSPKHFIGSGLMAAPFVYIFSLIDRMIGSGIINLRTAENIPHSWSAFGFVFATCFYFWIACFLLYKGLRYIFKNRHASLAVILMVLCQGVPLFAFRRPVFPHIYEFFIQSLLVFLLLKNNKIDLNLMQNYWILFGIGITIGLIVLVRFNNVLAAIIWPPVLLINNRSAIKKSCFWKALIFTYASAVIFVIAFKIIPDYYNRHYAYGYAFLFNVYHPIHYLKLILHILFGLDWGLIFSAPFIIIGFITLICFRSPLKKQFLICLLPILVNFYCTIMWRSNGGWYGYRYIIASVIPLLVYPLAFLLQWSEEKYSKKIIVIYGLIAILPLLSMLSFEGNSSNLTLSIVDIYLGTRDWGNNTYQLEVWKTLLFHPKESLIAVFKGGPLYLIYLTSVLFNAINKLPSIILEKYPIFQFTVMVKVFIIYTLPFFLYWIVRKSRLLKET